MKPIEFIDRKSNTLIQENPPGEGYPKFLYHNPLGKLPLHLLIKRKFLSSLYGRLMNRRSSKNKIQPFVDEYRINMDEAVKPVKDFTSFNDFFYRKLKPEARKIEKGLVSPADGKILAFENVSALKKFFVKGREFSLAEYLQDENLAETYKNSTLFIIRLAPNDYHRFHFPYEGKASQSYEIKGSYFSVSPYAVSENFTQVFCENKREYTILSTKDKGDIVVSPVGATMVGAIVETYEKDSVVQKGDEMGYFAFGGSSVLMLVNSDKVTVDEDILENTKNGMETRVSMGERIGL